jgi:hypothetical protein
VVLANTLKKNLVYTNHYVLFDVAQSFVYHDDINLHAISVHLVTF